MPKSPPAASSPVDVVWLVLVVVDRVVDRIVDVVLEVVFPWSSKSFFSDSDPCSSADCPSRSPVVVVCVEVVVPFTRGELAVTGSDLLMAGVPVGPDVGKMLDQLLEAVLDEPELNTRETLLAMVREER